jgi:ferredoxin
MPACRALKEDAHAWSPRWQEHPGMKIVVDLNRCQGYAQCAFLAPTVFEMHGEEALMYMPLAPEHERERVRRAAAACPVQAILVEEQAAPDVP